MSYDQTLLDTVIGYADDPELKTRITDYFSVVNTARQTLFDVFVEDDFREFPRASNVLNRDRITTGIPGFIGCPYHDNDLLEDGRTDFLPWASGSDLWTSHEFLKYVWLKGDGSDYWNNVKVCEIGAGVGFVAMLLAECGAQVTTHEFSGESQMVQAVNYIEHGVEVSINPARMEVSTADTSHDVYIFANTFYRQDFCEWNIPLTRHLAGLGKEVLVSRPLHFHDETTWPVHSEDEYTTVLDVKFPTDPDTFGARQVWKMKTP